MGDGKGTPWGPMETGQPDTPRLETNPYAVQGAPQMDDLRRALMSRISRGAGRARESGLAGLQRAGVGGSEATRAMGNIAGDQAQQISEAEAGIDAQDWQNKMGLMQALNANRMQKYGIDAQRFGQEQQGRGDFWKGLTNTAGTLGTLALLA